MTKRKMSKLRKSIIIGAIEAVRERLLPELPGVITDAWYDSETGEEWTGPEVLEVCQRIFRYTETVLNALE